MKTFEKMEPHLCNAYVITIFAVWVLFVFLIPDVGLRLKDAAYI